MKCEPYGTLNLNTKNAKRLGFLNAMHICIIQLQLISNLIISKPISLVKAALVCLQIPIV
jgi:hypothetical protein